MRLWKPLNFQVCRPDLSLVCLLLVLVSCRAKPQAPASTQPDLLAVIGSQKIRVEDFKTELTRRARQRPAGLAHGNLKKELLDELITLEAVFQRASDEGFAQNPQIIAAFKRLVVAKFEETKRAGEDPVVSESEVQWYYATNGARFGTPERRRGSILYLRVSETAPAERKAELRLRAEELRAAVIADGGRPFASMAVQHSEDQTTRYQGGDMGWFKAGDSSQRREPAVVDALFALDTSGVISEVITTPKGYYLVKLTEVARASVPPLADVADGIRHLVMQQKQAQATRDFVAQQKAGLAIQVNQPLLESITVPEAAIAAKSAPPATPAF